MRMLAGVIACCSVAIACSHAPPPGARQALLEEEREPAPRPPTGPDVVVGAYLPLTGSQATFGIAVSNGIAIAVAEQNGAGGVRGRRIVVRTLDTAGRATEAAAAVHRLVTDEGAVAILGEVSSTASLAGGAVAQRAGVPMISPTATNPAVTQIGDMISRACMLDEAQATVMASFARVRLKLARVAVLYDKTQPYSSMLATLFEQAFTRLGGTIAIALPFDGSSLEIQAQLEAIRDAQVDAVFVPTYYGPVGVIARKLRDLGVTAPLLGGDGWDSRELGKNAGAALDGSYYTNAFAADDPRPVVQRFVKQYRKRHGVEPDALAALGYDSARLLFAAMTRARSLSGADVAAAIAATKGFFGVTGSLTMGPDREPKRSIAVVQMRAGKPALAQLVLPP